MFRRGMNRPLRRTMMADISPALQRANQLMSAGQYAEAATIFEQFARGAFQRNGPRAPQFFLQAGRARILAGQVPEGFAHLLKGLNLLASRGDFQHLARAGQRVVTDLNQRGLKVEAADIEAWLRHTLPVSLLVEAVAHGAQPPRLPPNCSGCGVPLHADEVEWSDDFTAKCPYCGSAVRAD